MEAESKLKFVYFSMVIFYLLAIAFSIYNLSQPESEEVDLGEVIGRFFMVIILIFGFFPIITSIFLYKRKPWARIVAIILNIISSFVIWPSLIITIPNLIFLSNLEVKSLFISQ